MLPTNPSGDGVHGAALEPHKAGDFRAIIVSAVVKITNFTNDILCKNGKTVRLASCFYFVLTALIKHVRSVLLRCSGPQVGWVAAFRMSNARVENMKPVRNVNFVVRNPSNFMCSSRDGFTLSPNSKSAIPTLGLGGQPRPAFIGRFYFHLAPESFLNFWREYLREQFWRYRLPLHNSVVLICATLSAVRSARGHFFYTI